MPKHYQIRTNGSHPNWDETHDVLLKGLRERRPALLQLFCAQWPTSIHPSCSVFRQSGCLNADPVTGRLLQGRQAQRGGDSCTAFPGVPPSCRIRIVSPKGRDKHSAGSMQRTRAVPNRVMPKIPRNRLLHATPRTILPSKGGFNPHRSRRETRLSVP